MRSVTETDAVWPRSASSPLPSSIAQQILYLEECLEISCSLESVQELQLLYSKAIEYYEAMNDSKYHHYLSRLRSLLSKQDVIYLLNNPDYGCLRRHPSFIKRKIEDRQHKFSWLFPDTLAENERMIEENLLIHSENTSRQAKRIQQDLRCQLSQLQERIDSRKRKMKNSKLDFGDVQCSSSFDNFERNIEEVLEWYFLEIDRAKKDFSNQTRKKKENDCTSETEDEKEEELCKILLNIEEQKKQKIDQIKRAYSQQTVFSNRN